LAPKKLVIPISKTAQRSGFIRAQDTDAKEYKLHALMAEYPDLSTTEAAAYLELADWVLKDAVRSAKEDKEWEHECADEKALRAGEIRIRYGKAGFSAQGAGIRTKKTEAAADDGDEAKKIELSKVTSEEAIPEIASKTVKARDMYAAAAQHDSFGVELKSLTKPLLPKDESSLDA
jgi:hypothetical protein